MCNDEYVLIDDIKHEIEPILNFLEIHTGGGQFKISLKSDISFKHFNQYHPHINKNQLISLFNWCEEHETETRQAIKNLTGDV